MAPLLLRPLKAHKPWTRYMPMGSNTEAFQLKGWFDAGVTCVGLGSQLIQQGYLKKKIL